MTKYVISGGETLNGTTVTGGGSVSSIVLSAGDVVSVTSGGNIENLTLTKQTINVANNASGSNIVVSSGGVAVLSGGSFVSGITVFKGGVLSASGANVAGIVINSGGTLRQPSGTIANPVTLGVGADIIFTGPGSNVTYTSGFSGGNQQVTVTSNAGNGLSETVTLAGSGYAFTSTVSGVKPELIVTATCFAGGTEILTERGAVAVEALQPDDTVIVRRDGQDVPEPVTWVGSATIDLARHAYPERAAPIRIRAGALADGIPVRDLVVSPEHCLIISGRCVPAKLLVNGGLIVREYWQQPFIYYHLELARHGILIAEGAAAESYLDTGNRSSFDNAGSARLLHPTFDVHRCSDRWMTEACAPLADMAQEVVPIWQALADRSAALGWVAPDREMVDDPDLHILVDGERQEPISGRNGRFVFAVPAAARSVALMSRSFIPADSMVAAERDARRLGVRVNWLAIRRGSQETVLPADHPALQDGWFDPETTPAATWRWTNGAGLIPWENGPGAAILTVCCAPAALYPMPESDHRLVA